MSPSSAPLAHPSAAPATREFTLCDEIHRITIKPVREQQELIVRNQFPLFFDRVQLIGRQGSTQSTRVETGVLDRPGQLTG